MAKRATGSEDSGSEPSDRGGELVAAEAARRAEAMELGIRPGDIHSLTDFHRNAKEHIARLKASGRPGVLTVNGRAEVVTLSPEAFERLAAMAAELQDLRSLRASLNELDRGEPGLPGDQLVDELERRRAAKRRSGRKIA